MESKASPWPFNLLDIFGYLGQGYLVCIWVYMYVVYACSRETVDPILGYFPLLHEPLVSVPLVIIAAYTLGHILADFAYRFLELGFALRLVGSPTSYALGTATPCKARYQLVRLLVWLLGIPEYTRRFSPQWCQTFRSNYKRQTSIDFEEREALRICFHVVKGNCPGAMERISTFLNLYSFSRNAAFTLGLLALLTSRAEIPGAGTIAAVMFVAAVLLVGRYLKFFRLYSDEVYLTFFAYTTVSNHGGGPQALTP